MTNNALSCCTLRPHPTHRQVYSGIQDRSEPPDSLLLVGYRPHDADGQELTNGHCYGVGWAPHGNWLAGGYSGHLGGVARVWDITQGTMVGVGVRM